MRICLLSLIFALSQINARSQQKELDSLLQALQSHTPEDSMKVVILNEIVYAYHNIDPGKGLEFADKAIALAAKLNIPLLIASAHSHKGISYASRGQDSLARLMYLKASEIHSSIGNMTGVAVANNNLGLLAFNRSDYRSAADHHTRSMESFIAAKDTFRTANLMINLGVDYQYLSDFNTALEYYFKALALFEQKGNDPTTYGVGITNSLTNIGLVYKNIGQYEKALEYYQRALEKNEAIQNLHGVASTLGNMAVAYELQGRPEESVRLLQRSLAINEKIENPRGIASDLTNLAAAYEQLKQYGNALQHIQRAMDMYDATEDRRYQASAKILAAEIYLNLPDKDLAERKISNRKRFEIAENYLEQALKIAREIKVVELESNAMGAMAGLYEKKKDYSRAFDALTTYMQLRDSVMNDEKRLDIAKKEAAFEFEKRELLQKAETDKQIAFAAAEVERHKTIRNAIAVSGLVILCSAVSGLVLYKRKRDADVLRKEADLNAQITDTEMKALRSQMNPHFIFNSLNSIRHYISRNNTRLADEYLVKFAMLMRQVFENAEQKKVLLSEDLKALELYIQMEEARLNNKFNYHIHIDESIDPDNTLIPPLLLQPFVENSIWHGIMPKEGNAVINIDVTKTEASICCTIADDGVGLKKELPALSDESPSGTIITRKRIALMNRAQRTTASVRTVPTTEGTKIEIMLPLEYSF
ncbi:MAG: tetratricopeptide repeat protein [Chitinophagaceae bacterium]|nr:tetratricopeptide repeat protein [Chitinophagaceae bacterium]